MGIESGYNGIYKIKHPLFLIFRPKLEIFTDKERGKPRGHIKGLFFKADLELIKVKEAEIIFQFPVNIFTVEIILRFCGNTSFIGILDMPIGTLRFKGQKIREID